MHTLQWRMNDCFRQQRFPEPGYVSDAITDLLTYLARQRQRARCTRARESSARGGDSHEDIPSIDTAAPPRSPLAFAAAGRSRRPRRQADRSMMKRDFHAKGIATIDRLDEDAVQAHLQPQRQPSAQGDRRSASQHDQLADIKYPADGKFLGDWKAGEKIAQNGRGMTWSDKPGNAPNGGSCYNCHQIGPKEMSFGTIGPSLYQFGKIRGYGPGRADATSYGKIYNAKAFNLCSNMPRFGHVGTLDRAADQGSGRAAARPEVAGQQVMQLAGA